MARAGLPRPVRLLAVAAALTAVLSATACSGSAEGGPPVSGVSLHDDDGMNGAVLAKPYHLPDTTLTATDGSAYSLTKDTTKPLTLVFFGYTHCPDICQVVMADIASSMARLDGQDRAKVGMLFITSDPARDTPQVLRQYLDRFDPSFEGLTGSVPRIKQVGHALGVSIEKGKKLPSGGYEVTHGTQILGVERSGAVPVVWTQMSAADLAEDITKLLHRNR